MSAKKIVLVTGGTSGIGLGTIEYLLEQDNYEVISLSRGDKNLSLAKEKLCNDFDNQAQTRNQMHLSFGIAEFLSFH